jgi:hypothetical protein
MTYRCILAALFCGALLVGLTACNDSSTVGLGVGPDTLQGGDLETVTLRSDSIGTVRQPDITSSTRSSADGFRFLVGTVTDPLVGTMKTTGYFDVEQPTIFSGFNAIDRVELVLQPEYVYGDTTETQTIRVRDATEEIVATMTSDSTLAPGTEITQFSISRTDSTLTVELPQQWLNDNRSVLRTEDNFDDSFQGFVFETVSGNRVIGFDRDASFLRVISVPEDQNGVTDIDTLQFSGAKAFTKIERTSTVAPPPDGVVLIDGFGQNLVTTFDFTAEGSPFYDQEDQRLRVLPVNFAEFYLQPDTLTTARETPSGFQRPTPESFFFHAKVAERLRLVSNGAIPACSELGLFSNTETFRCDIPTTATGRGVFSSSRAARAIIDRELRADTPVVPQYFFGVGTADVIFRNSSVRQPSITPVLISTTDDLRARTPRLSATVTPIEE